MDEVDQLFARLRQSPMRAMGADPNAIPYETQSPGIFPQGFLDEFDGVGRPAMWTGVYNGTFAAPPTTPGSNIDNETNPLPGGWRFVQSSGTAVTASWAEDATIDADGMLKLSLAAGAAGDEGYAELLMPIVPSSGGLVGYSPLATMRVPTLGTATLAAPYLEAQFVQADGATTTGTAGTHAGTTLTGINVTGVLVFRVIPNTTGIPPVDAAFLRLRLGLERAAATTGQSGTVYFSEVFALATTPIAMFADGLGDPLIAYALNDSWYLESLSASSKFEFDPSDSNYSSNPSLTLTEGGESAGIYLKGHDNTGVRGIQVASVSTGSIAAGASANVTLTWPTAFQDENYRVVVSCELNDATDRIPPTLYLKTSGTNKTTADVVARVTNNAGSALTFTVNAIAIAD